jgi:hypothetical protein
MTQHLLVKKFRAADIAGRYLKPAEKILLHSCWFRYAK